MENRNLPSRGTGTRLRTQPLADADAAQAVALLASAASLVLASSDRSGQPLASYAPFVAHDGALYVFVSRLAAHHTNLIREAPVSAMIIEDEAHTRQPYARRRITFECTLAAIGRDSARFRPALDALEARFGEIVATLRQLGDFDLMALTPHAGSFVQGFGKAHRLNAEQSSDIIARAASVAASSAWGGGERKRAE